MEKNKKTNTVLRDRLAVAIGAILDWYDFALFGFFSSIFSVIFFPSEDPNTSLILTLGVWAVSFLARPFGAILFGYIGDKYGRAFCFKLISILVLFPACIFPFVPTYDTAGIFAPILVTVLRVMLGFSIGAEFAGNFVYQCESTTPNKTFFAASLGSCTGSAGILLASFIASLTYSYGPDIITLHNSGWRIAFAFGSILSIISFILRRKIQETKVFENIRTNKIANENSLFRSFKHTRSELFLAIGVVCLHAVTFYFIFMFLPIYTNKYLHHPEVLTLQNNALILSLRIMIIPFWGILADKIGGLRLLVFVTLGFTLLAFPLLLLLKSTVGISYYFGIAILALMSSVNAGVVPGLLIRILDPKTVYSVMSLTFNIAFGAFGGLVPIVSVFLINKTNYALAPATILITSSLITLFSLSKVHKYYGKKLLTY